MDFLMVKIYEQQTFHALNSWWDSPQITVYQKGTYPILTKKLKYLDVRIEGLKQEHKKQHATLQVEKKLKVDQISRKISLILLDLETLWNAKQEVKLKERLELKLKKAEKAKDYTRKLLQDCKSWEGPAHLLMNCIMFWQEKINNCE